MYTYLHEGIFPHLIIVDLGAVAHVMPGYFSSGIKKVDS